MPTTAEIQVNEPAKLAAEFSPGWSERSERNPGLAILFFLEPAKRAKEPWTPNHSTMTRSGKTFTVARTVARFAGSEIFLRSIPRAALRFAALALG
jgi:hypothetical protein